VKTLVKGNSFYPKSVRGVEMLGNTGRLNFQQTAQGLENKLPPRNPDLLGGTPFGSWAEQGVRLDARVDDLAAA